MKTKTTILHYGYGVFSLLNHDEFWTALTFNKKLQRNKLNTDVWKAICGLNSWSSKQEDAKENKQKILLKQLRQE